MKSNIGWTDASWNPYLWKCQKVSEGCKNCYMMALAVRYGQDPKGEFGTCWTGGSGTSFRPSSALRATPTIRAWRRKNHWRLFSDSCCRKG